ncbi:MAG: hypothetical protein ACRENG_15455 [bacterium]
MPDSVLMVIDTKGDTGFVVPIRAAERLSNVRFGVLPRVFDLWGQLEAQNNVLNSRVQNLEQQVQEATRIAETRKQEVDELKKALGETEGALKRKNFGLKFFRGTTVAFAIATATLLIIK